MSFVQGLRKRPVISGILAALTVWVIALPTALADVPAPETSNPSIAPACGLNVALVLDESGSIGGYFGPTEPTGPDYVDDVRAAFRDLVAGLGGTGSNIFVSEFADNGNVGLAPIAIDGNEAAIESYISNNYNPHERGLTGEFHTNWEAGLEVVRSAVTSGSFEPDLVIMLTDGIANKRYPRALFSGGFINGVAEDYAGINGFLSPVSQGPAVDEAIDEGNWIKAQGIRTFGVGVNLNATGVASLSSVVGPTAWDGDPGTLLNADYVNLNEFSDLRDALAAIATYGCNISVTVNKSAVTDGVAAPGQGWEFTATVEETPSKWVIPASATGPTATAVTNDAGKASFSWMPSDIEGTSTVTLTETGQEGWTNESFVCAAQDASGEPIPVEMPAVRAEAAGSAVVTDLRPGTHVMCDVVNTTGATTTTTTTLPETTTTTVPETTTTIPETTTTVPTEVEGTTTIPVEETTTTVPVIVESDTDERPGADVGGTQQDRLPHTGSSFPIPLAFIMLASGGAFLLTSTALRRRQA